MFNIIKKDNMIKILSEQIACESKLLIVKLSKITIIN